MAMTYNYSIQTIVQRKLIANKSPAIIGLYYQCWFSICSIPVVAKPISCKAPCSNTPPLPLSHMIIQHTLALLSFPYIRPHIPLLFRRHHTSNQSQVVSDPSAPS